ncbi:SCO family protein [Teichococcus vastitatis]|uniref:SCO family protein n=1 Tax=Teichococcus vastitatis TaxID=2307076 RepID=A0ABS9W5L1_9PROT|nr:SCO family protein [Pseudoroseomonas vastitatis]MCI0753879.1 SCO family protein [Pseudoroseomonas vastitatis]
MQRIVRLLVLILILGLGGLWSAAWFTRQPNEALGDAFLRNIAQLTGSPAPTAINGTQLPEGMTLGGPFRLVNQNGRSVTEADFSDTLMVAYFGYTFCPDICPTELGSIVAAMDLLAPEQAARVTPTLFTVDPERDTPEHLKAYVTNFHPRMVGLTGSVQQVAETARRFRVFYNRVERPEMSEYLMDHTSYIYLLGKGGAVRTLLRPQSSPEAIAEAIRQQLSQS